MIKRKLVKGALIPLILMVSVTMTGCTSCGGNKEKNRDVAEVITEAATEQVTEENVSGTAGDITEAVTEEATEAATEEVTEAPDDDSSSDSSESSLSNSGSGSSSSSGSGGSSGSSSSGSGNSSSDSSSSGSGSNSDSSSSDDSSGSSSGGSSDVGSEFEYDYSGKTNAGDIRLPYYAAAGDENMDANPGGPCPYELNTITKRKIIDGYGRTGEVDGYYKVGGGSNPRLSLKILAMYGINQSGCYASSYVPVGQYDEGEIYFCFSIIKLP